MSFEPRNEKHAIVEAVFGVELARPLTNAQVEALAAAHDKWRDELPKLGRTIPVQVALGPVPPPFPQLAPGVTFDRIKPDGSIAFRLKAEHDSFFVNCLEYDRWATSWGKARKLLKSAMSTALRPDVEIRSLMLQYLDAFEWRGRREDYNVADLIDLDSSIMPRNLIDRGELWHVHQGWYRYGNLPIEGRVLERSQVDSVLEKGKTPVLKTDIVVKYELKKPIKVRSLKKGDGEFESVFDALHVMSKQVLASILNKAAADRIGLNG